MSQGCEQYREQLESYLGGLLEDKQQIAWLLEHTATCPACSARLNEEKRQDQDLDRWVDSLEPVVAESQEKSISALRGLDAPQAAGDQGGLRIFDSRPLIGTAAAAVILIAAGFLAGRLSRPAVDPQQVIGAVLEQLRPELTQEFLTLREEVAAKMTEELQTAAGQTLALSNWQTNQRLEELIEAIQQAQMQDRQWVLSALGQIEQNRIRDQMKMQEGLAAFAVLTGDELARTHQKIDNLVVSGAQQ
jgi:hypothetical protein